MGALEDDLTEGHREQNKRVNFVMSLVRSELERAMAKHGRMKSGHEGYAVILEELDEMWHEVKHGVPEKAYQEAIQVAAMAIRFVVDLGK